MESRTPILAMAKLYLQLEDQQPLNPQPQTVVKKSFLIRFGALALLLLCSLAVYAQTPVPIPPSPWEYQIYGASISDVTPLVHNICYFDNAPTVYDLFSIGTVDNQLSVDRCYQVKMPFPPPPLGPPYEFTSAADCQNQQNKYFSLDPDAFYLTIKYAIYATVLHPELCTPAFKAAPALSGPFMIPYNYESPWPHSPKTPAL